MAGHDTDQSEKILPPSPYKLEQARQRGTVVKSAEMNSFLGMLTGLLFLVALGDYFIRHTLLLCAQMFRQAGQMRFDLPHLMHTGSGWMIEALTLLSPLVAAIMIVGVLSNMLQTGPVFSFQPLKPDFSRVNPVTGFKRFFTMKLVFELFKTLLKLSVFCAVAWFALDDIAANILRLYQHSVYGVLPYFLSQAVSLMFRLVLVMAVFALIDFLFVRWEFLRQMRMTPREMKDEIKRREGDPMIRRKRKEIENELRKKSQSLNRVKEGDVVITNPTHYAVVLKYDRGTMLAPVVIAKGADNTARGIREKAFQANVPLIQHAPLARRLYKEVKIDAAIPVDCFVAVARVFNQAYQLKKAQQATAS